MKLLLDLNFKDGDFVSAGNDGPHDGIIPWAKGCVSIDTGQGFITPCLMSDLAKCTNQEYVPGSS